MLLHSQVAFPDLAVLAVTFTGLAVFAFPGLTVLAINFNLSACLPKARPTQSAVQSNV